MKLKYKIIYTVIIAALYSCNDYLDVVPDNVATLDLTFANRITTENYLFTCYSYLPNPSNYSSEPSFLGGNESWIYPDDAYWFNIYGFAYPLHMAKYGQNSNNPYINFWSGGNGGTNLWIAIRDCNIFLENVHKPRDVDEPLRKRWIAEVKFLKAYYHFYLLRMYGAIPIVRENIRISTEPDKVKVFREPVDDVVEYIVELLDEAIVDLPTNIQNETEELGRITAPIALALKAKTLLLAASDIFNGNSYYANIKDSKGINLFSTSFDVNKWEVAAEAVKEALSTAELAGFELYEYDEYMNFTDSTKTVLGLRFAMTKEWNNEIIWGSSSSTNSLQRVAAFRTTAGEAVNMNLVSMLSPTFATVERFYTNHGLPIDQDKTWNYTDRYDTYQVEEDERYYMQQGYVTTKLNHAREPRFYASLLFDGALYYGKGETNVREQDFFKVTMKKGNPAGMQATDRYSITGYLPKKVLNVETSWNSSGGFTLKNYSFPYIRLADLYLMYAEALNEVALHNNTGVPSDVYTYIDKVRKRAGLEGVMDSWQNYSIDPNKPNSPEGMRDIIRRERLNELVFEGHHYWDLIRWKEAEKEFNRPIYGWNVVAENTGDYYEVIEVFRPKFSIKNYLAPIRLNDLDRNSNLVQNYGW